MNTAADKSILVKCDAASGCGHEWRLQRFEERALIRDRLSHGFACPECGHWYQTYITDTKARRMQKEVAKARQEAESLPSGKAKSQAHERVKRLAEQLQQHMAWLKTTTLVEGPDQG